MLYHAGAKLSQEVLQEQGIIMGYMQSRLTTYGEEVACLHYISLPCTRLAHALI